jgi:hypothetical protein
MSARLTQLMAFLEATPNEPFLLFAIAKEHEGLGDKEQTLFFYEKLVQEHSIIWENSMSERSALPMRLSFIKKAWKWRKLKMNVTLMVSWQPPK